MQRGGTCAILEFAFETTVDRHQYLFGLGAGGGPNNDNQAEVSG